jgi:hypothetical protein
MKDLFLMKLSFSAFSFRSVVANRIIHNEKNVSALFLKNNKLWWSGVSNSRDEATKEINNPDSN